jgi:transcriptional regulator with XRE-family HTH domain
MRLTQATFAKQVGVRRQYLWTLENGASYTLGTLAAVLTQIRGQGFEPALSVLVGQRVREVRKSKGLSQETLAEHCGVSSLYISKIERGTANATLDLLDVLVTALGVAGEFVIEGLEGAGLDDRLRAVEESYLKFQNGVAKAESQ